jgi:hypothetical protein
MVRYQDTLWCDGCGIEIRWKPVIKYDRTYCCQTCLLGEICKCEEFDDDYRPVLDNPKYTQYSNV